MSNEVIIRDAVKRYGDFTALNGVSLNIKEGEFFTLLGPSGCGKTTLLRMIAGFNSIEGGDFYFGEKRINDVPAHKRDIGMVFQNYAIFPHLTVKENVAYGLKARKVGKQEMETRVSEALELVQISHLADRKPNELSGGQQQRVALARAFVIEPSVLLMDEPLSNLDAKLRVQMRTVIKKLQRRLGITTIYVTHDQEEALTLSDRIAVFNKGYIEQIGTPNEVYNHSATEFVCNFIGDINRLGEEVSRSLGADTKMHNYIRLERIHVNVPPKETDVVLEGRVESREYYGLYIKYYINLGSQVIKVIEKNDGINIYEPGETVKAVLNPRDVMAYPPAQEGDAQ